MSRPDKHEFFTLYRTYRFDDQRDFYKGRHEEFEQAHAQAITINTVLLVLTAIVGGLAAFAALPVGVRLGFLLAAVIFPILATAITAYNTLYGFEQQEKLYQDTITALSAAYASAPDAKQGLDDVAYGQQLDEYVKKVENVFLVEQGQWGQLAKVFKPPD
ncbi:MAG: hypothetical protein PVSMB2_17400 [Ktedonobacteraceae bacterium]